MKLIPELFIKYQHEIYSADKLTILCKYFDFQIICDNCKNS